MLDAQLLPAVMWLFGRAACPCRCSSRRSRAAEHRVRWARAGVAWVDVVVRSLSGEPLSDTGGPRAFFDTPVARLVDHVCEHTGARRDTVCLCAGDAVLLHGQRLGDCVSPKEAKGSDLIWGGGKLEVTLVRVLGRPIAAYSARGREMRVLDKVPLPGDRCHSDRNYTFTSLGDFATRPNMFYVLTANSDKNTPSDEVMWTLDVRAHVIIYVNFRSHRHLTQTGAEAWLTRGGWKRSALRTTVSTGIPHGPYMGPVFFKRVNPGIVELMGANCGEGTFFVFVELDLELHV